MPCYFFNVYDGQSLLDDEGIDLSTTDEACQTAVCLAGAILKDDAAKIARGRDWRMEVTDQTGIVLFRLDVTLVASSAHSGLRQRQAQRAG